MDYFIMVFNGFCLIIQSILQLIFIGQFVGNRGKIWCFFLYPISLFILSFASIQSPLLNATAILIQFLLLFVLNHVAFQCRYTISFLSTTIAIYISQLSFGLINSIESILFPHFLGTPLLYLLLILATVTGFAICIGCYFAVLKLISLNNYNQIPYLSLLLLPGLFFFLIELYLLHISYSQISLTLSLAETGRHSVLLFIQGLGLSALLCTLYTYRQIYSGFQAQAALASLTQAAQTQKIYIAEARMRYEQTKAFRHDMKNHLLLLDGLLSNGQFKESQDYLKKLVDISTSLSFPYQTGNSVVDILLSEKLGIAQANGIQTDVSLLFPKSCKIDDVDVCIIFSNALDNALNACLSVYGSKFIDITGTQQGDFYMLKFHNTCTEHILPKIGTGLSNIKAVAEKYHGTMSIETYNRHFFLYVLLNISFRTDDNSRQTN